jgi:WD repeat-containing protein 59
VSFRTVPQSSYSSPTISAPVGNLGILDQVRAGFPPRYLPISSRDKTLGHTTKISPTQLRRNITDKSPRLDDGSASGSIGGRTIVSASQATPIPIAIRKRPTMSRGNFGGRSAKIEPTTWFTSLKVGAKRDSSGGPPSGESGDVSRTNSRSRPPSHGQIDLPVFTARRRSGSREDEPKELDTNSALHEESVILLVLFFF